MVVIDFILHINEHLATLMATYGIWVYAILFIIIFCETGLVVTPFLPGDSLLFAAGALCAGYESPVNTHLLFLLLCVAAILGDNCNYFIGRFFGKRLFSNPKSKVFKQSYLIKANQFYEKHGGKAIVLSRFVPIIRTFAPFVAGMGKMNYKHFSFFNITGGISWVAIFIYAGHFFGNMDIVKRNLELLLFGIIFISLLPPVIEYYREKRKAKA